MLSRFPVVAGGNRQTAAGATLQAPSRLPGRLIIGGYRLSSQGRLGEVLLGRKTKKGLRFLGAARSFAGTPLRKELHRHLRMLHMYECPFLSNFDTVPEGMTEEQMEDCIWVEPSTRVWVTSGPGIENGRLASMAVLQLAD